ncbi:hypothetical protein [Pseudomonas sp. NPDC087690]|uniref:hypothetical protein n=1 Tax=Pseudomonas sp. NPDC087690 TaxID=3364446 RepID=UPI000F083DAC
MNRIAILCLCTVLTACSSPDLMRFTGNVEHADQISLERQNEMIKEGLQSCYDFFGVKSAEAERKAKSAWRWTLAGIISGAVIAPALTAANAAANAPWIAGFSGFGGASVAAVNNANNFGIGPASSVEGLLAVGAAVRDDMRLALDVNKPFQERSDAAARASTSCSFPSSVEGYMKAQNSAAQQKTFDDQQKAMDARLKAQEDRMLELQAKQRELEKKK